MIKAYESRIAELDAQGRLYEVELAPDETDLLDWDAPLSEQSEKVRQALAMIDPEMWHPEAGAFDPAELGQSIYKRLQNSRRDYAITAGRNHDTTLAATQAAASRDLRDFGIPGLRYLDAGSRGAGGSRTRNIVVWDQDVLDEAARRGVKKK